jgi:hypothetical protein
VSIVTKEMLDAAVIVGRNQERERIIQYLEKTYNWNQAIEFDRDELIAIIKGEKSE